MTHTSSNITHDQLIDSLSTSLKPSPVFYAGSVLSTLSMILTLLVLATIVGIMGVRADWQLASHLKVAVLAAASLAALAMVTARATPLHYGKKWAWLAVAATIVAGTLFTVKGYTLTFHQATSIPTFDWCLSFIAGIGIAGFTVMRFVLLRARPHNPRLFSAILATLSALIASTGYAMFCPVDSITYIGTAYVAGIAVAAMAGYLFPRKQWYW